MKFDMDLSIIIYMQKMDAEFEKNRVKKSWEKLTNSNLLDIIKQSLCTAYQSTVQTEQAMNF